MLVQILSGIRKNVHLIKKNFNKAVPVISSLEHRNITFRKKVTFNNFSSSMKGSNHLHVTTNPILFRANRFYLAPVLRGSVVLGQAKNYFSEARQEDKGQAETAHFVIGKVLEFARRYKQQASSGDHLNRRKLLELYGLALNLARKFGSKQAKNLEAEFLEIIKIFLWEELRIKQDVAVANLAQSMTLFQEKLKNIRLNFQVKKISSQTIAESLHKTSCATEELVQWMFGQVKDLLGMPPCRFTIVSMGSLASGMASPYSDVDYLVLLESSMQKNRTYFQNFADIFDFLIIGFGESPIVEAMDLLNSDPTLSEVYKRFKKGMRVDEHKKPQDFNRLFGLITTAGELLDRLPHNIIHQPENHLTAALFSTNYLWGDTGLFEEFQKLFVASLGTREYVECIHKLLRQDINDAKVQHLFLANRNLAKSKEAFELKPLLMVCIRLAKGLAVFLRAGGQPVLLKAHPFDTLNELLRTEHINKEQYEIWWSLIQGLFAQRLILQQETESAEASISFQVLEKAIPISQLCAGLQTMIEIVEAQLNQRSEFKPLPLIQDVLRSEIRVLGEVPRQDNIFVPRKTLLQDLQKKLQVADTQKNTGTKMVVCVGLGGVGKTQFLLNYFRNSKQVYAYKAWFRADNVVTLEQSYRDMAKAWGFLDEKAKIEEVIKYVKRHLSEHPGWLFVYDNATSYEEIEGFLPEAGGVAILSTRHQRWPETFERLLVPVMSPEEALEMIGVLSGRKIEGERKAAETLAKALGYLPLALAQASAYIKETKPRVTIADYLELYKKWEAGLLAEDILPQVGKEVRSLPVAITWNITLEAILEKQKASPHPTLALELLTVCAYLASDKIPRDYLLTWLKAAHPKLENPELRLNHCLRTLVQYSMMQHEEDAFVGVHRLVQTVLRGQQSNVSLKKKLPYPELNLKWYETLLTAGVERYNRKTQVLADERKQIQLLPHFRSLIQHYSNLWNIENPSPIVANVLGSVGDGFWTLGQALAAKLYHERVLKIQEAHYGKEDVQVARTLNNLGATLRVLGESGQAKVLYERALKIQEAHYGKEDIQVARTLNNLGAVLHDLGESGKAKTLLEQALKTQEAHYGKEGVQVAVTLNTLGLVLRDLGENEQAKALWERALKNFRQHYPENHSSVHLVFRNLKKLSSLEQQSHTLGEKEIQATIKSKKTPKTSLK